MADDKIFGLDRFNLIIGLLVTLIGLVAGLIGFGWHASQAWTTMQMTQIMDEQTIKNNSLAIKEHEDSIREIQTNAVRTLQMVSDMHK